MIQTTLSFGRKVNDSGSSNKRKDPPPPAVAATTTAAVAAAAPTKKITPPKGKGKSPFETRLDVMKECRDSADDTYALIERYNILRDIPGKLEELGIDEDVEDLEDLGDEKIKEAQNNLSMEEVDRYFSIILVRRESMFERQDEFAERIFMADPRGPDYMNTYSGYCMGLEILKQLSTVTSVLNKAVKDLKNSIHGITSVVPGIAKEAFDITCAVIFACHDEDHWRNDTDCPENVDKIFKKVSNLLKDLLWFHDEELGIIDPFTRKSLLNRLHKIAGEWNAIDWLEEKVKFASRKNSFGLGRSLEAKTSAPKAKASAPASAPASAQEAKASAPPPSKKLKTGGNVAENDVSSILAHLAALGDKLSLRCKTVVQLNIANASGSKSCRAVCSGSISLKKVSQLVAFLTGHTNDYEYHIQRGSSLKGSYLELSLDGKNKLWLGDNTLKKKAKAEGVGYAADKPIKLVQIFQGLTVDYNSGMIFDSESSKAVSLVWVSDKGDRYTLTAEGVLANKCVPVRPMPRVVDNDYKNARKKTGFGKAIRRTNTILKGDRKSARGGFYIGVSPAEARRLDDVNLGKPVCYENGSVEHSGWSFDNTFSAENIQSAGPPSSH